MLSDPDFHYDDQSFVSSWNGGDADVGEKRGFSQI